MKSIRDVITELRPEVLDDYGLVPALRWYAARFSDRTGIASEVRGDDELRLAPRWRPRSFASRKRLTNVARHARPRRTSVEVHRAAGGVRLVVIDDGVGFEAGAAAARARGWGRVNMRERARALGGGLGVESEPDRGARLVVEARSTGS